LIAETIFISSFFLFNFFRAGFFVFETAHGQQIQSKPDDRGAVTHRGKSELRRAGRSLTATRREPPESATEKTHPAAKREMVER